MGIFTTVNCCPLPGQLQCSEDEEYSRGMFNEPCKLNMQNTFFSSCSQLPKGGGCGGLKRVEEWKSAFQSSI